MQRGKNGLVQTTTYLDNSHCSMSLNLWTFEIIYDKVNWLRISHVLDWFFLFKFEKKIFDQKFRNLSVLKQSAMFGRQKQLLFPKKLFIKKSMSRSTFFLNGHFGIKNVYEISKHLPYIQKTSKITIQPRNFLFSQKPKSLLHLWVKISLKSA